jgi:uncharacterized membrane protein (DUF4010 family)
VLLPRVLLLSLALSPPVALALLPYLVPPLLVGAALVTAALWRQAAPATTASPPERQSPLRLWLAVQMAAAFQLAMWAIALARHTFGVPGVLASAAAIGLTSMDALTVSMCRLGAGGELAHLAAQSIAVGVVASTSVKLVLALALGAPAFRRATAGGLGMLMAASMLGLWLGG